MLYFYEWLNRIYILRKSFNILSVQSSNTQNLILPIDYKLPHKGHKHKFVFLCGTDSQTNMKMEYI